MATWVKEVPTDQLIDGEVYFVAKWHRDSNDVKHYRFSGRGLNGKAQWTVKPGIAIKAICNEKLRAYLNSDNTLTAVAIPADADVRWKARKRRF